MATSPAHPEPSRAARRPRSRALALASVVATLAAAGCGDDGSTDAGSTAASASAGSTVDDAQVEQGIEDDLSTSSTEVTSAKCPTDVEAKPGATFTCSVTFGNGATGKATVTQVGRNRFTYELKPGSVQVPGEVADAAVEKQLAAQGAPNATVSCPTNIIVKVGTTVTCDVSGVNGAASGSVTFTFSSDDGSVDPSSVETS